MVSRRFFERMATERKRGWRAVAGFTLVELLAVVAILTVLVAVALPAYNSYTTKSKFAEVVLASTPTKTAIVACAESGDCVSGQGSAAQIYLITQASATECASSMQNVCQTTTTTSDCSTTGVSCCPAGSTPTLLDYHAVGIGCCSFYDVWDYSCAVPTSTCSNQLVQTCQTVPQTVDSLPCVGGSGCTPPTKYVASVSFDQGGNIYATAVSGSQGLYGEQFILAPSYASGRVDWAETGSCKTRAGGAIC
jgi:type IV pilus assembly protein PilA